MGGPKRIPSAANSATIAPSSVSSLQSLLPREEVGDEHADRPQVRQDVEPSPRLEEHDLVDLARHHRVAHAVPLEVAEGGAEAGQAAPLEVVAQIGQLRVGHAADAETVDAAALAFQGLGDQQRIASPAGHHAHAANIRRFARASLGTVPIFVRRKWDCPV